MLIKSEKTTIQENYDWYHGLVKGIPRPIIVTTKIIPQRRLLSHIAFTSGYRRNMTHKRMLIM